MDDQGTLKCPISSLHFISLHWEDHSGSFLTYAQNALGTNQLDKLVLHAAGGVALSIGLEVAQVTDVTVGIGRSTVGLAVRVDCKGGSAISSRI